MEEIQRQEKKLFNLPENSWDNIYYLTTNPEIKAIFGFPSMENRLNKNQYRFFWLPHYF